MRPQCWGAARGKTWGGGGGRRGGAGTSLAPAGPSPRVPARRPHPPAGEPPGNARSAGGGDPRASEALRSPVGPPPFPAAYLGDGSPVTAPEVPAAPGAGLQGLSTGAAARRARSGRGPGPPPAGTGGRSSPSEVAAERPTSPGGVAMPWTPPGPGAGGSFVLECVPLALATPGAPDPVGTVPSFLFLLPRPRARLCDLPA